MSLYDKNVAVFLNRYPGEVNNVKIHQQQKNVLLTRRGSSSFQLWENETMLADTFNGAYPPVEQCNFTPKIGILLGLGLGKRLIDVVDTYSKSKKNIQFLVVIEPSYERFLKACQVTDFSMLFQQQNVMWFVGKSVTKVYEELYNLFFDLFLSRNRNNIFFFKHPLVYKFNKNYFDSIQKEIKQASELMFSSFGSQQDCFLGISNTIKNIENVNNTPGYNNLKDKFKNLPAVVVSTGPSLEKSIPKLKKYRNRFVLFSADASLKILLKHGITPDIVATLERDDETANFFNGLEDVKDKPYMVFFPLSPKKTVDIYDGPKFVTYRNYNYYDYFDSVSNKGTIKCGHSVAHMCAKLATVAGCNKIILVGQDLAYPTDNISTHAEGTVHGKKFQSKEDLEKFFIDSKFGRLHEVEGLHGKKYYTHDIFLYFAREFISEQKDSGNCIVNCTEAGLNIPDVPWVDFEKAVQSFPTTVNVKSVIKENHKLEGNIVEVDSLLETLNKLKRELEKDLRKLDEIKQDKPKKIRSLLRKIDQRRIDYYYPNKVMCGFIIESDSKLLLGLENEYNVLNMDKEPEMFKMLELTSKWFKECVRISTEVIQVIKDAR